jgi:Pentapeptide repeats (8 copies)
MADEQQLAVLRQGSDAWNAWREQNPYRQVDLSEADLGRSNLCRANLSGANLSGANLAGAELVSTNLSGADLSKTNLSWASLIGADRSGAILSEADFSGAILLVANFDGADLSGAFLVAANLIETNFTGAILTGCRVYGISAWNLKLEGAEQKNLVITPTGEPEITVDNLEVAQFIYLLLKNERIRHVIDTIGKKGVLLLGRFRMRDIEDITTGAAP